MVAPQPPRNAPALQQNKASAWQTGGMAVGMGLIATSALIGAFAYTRGNKALGDQMVKTRMIIVATTIGFYAGSTDILPPPPFFSSMFGRQPVHAQMKAWPGSGSSSNDAGCKQE